MVGVRVRVKMGARVRVRVGVRVSNDLQSAASSSAVTNKRQKAPCVPTNQTG